MTYIDAIGLISGPGWKARGKIDDADFDLARPLDLSLPTFQHLAARQLCEMFKAMKCSKQYYIIFSNKTGNLYEEVKKNSTIGQPRNYYLR
jgi:hypothetical protein